MSDAIIEVENLSKQYRLGEVSTGSLNHDINRLWHRVRGKEDPYLQVTHSNDRTKNQEPRTKNSPQGDYVWALEDINFEVKRGEVLGIIGRNGAGKSTLLKILSRVTAPTTGEVRVDGRIASLLEVGTGFHQDLTGRENIFLNGAILGMTKAEIRRKLDEIVEFSGCERYLDTPVKRYSSGMVVRLGFAVAAHLDPDILIVDEVLAVGDAEFQKKCIGKMQDVAHQGRTVLFVSHSMSSIQKLCSHGIVLDEGRLTAGPLPATEAVHRYLGARRAKERGPVSFKKDGFSVDEFKVTTSTGALVGNSVPHDQAHYVEIHFHLDRYDASFNVGYEICNESEDVVFISLTTDANEKDWPKISKGWNRVRSLIPAYLLNEGDYQLRMIASFHCVQWLVHPDKDGIQIPLSVRMGAGASPYWHGKRNGQLALLLPWEKMR